MLGVRRKITPVRRRGADGATVVEGASRGGSGGSVESYADKILNNINFANLHAQFNFDETTGVIADNYQGNASNDGTYVVATVNGDTFNDGEPAVTLPGVNNSGVQMPANFLSTLDPDLHSIALWAKVTNAGVWTDGGFRYVFYFRYDADNYVRCRKASTNNTLSFTSRFGGVSKAYTNNSMTTTDWFQIAVTRDQAADEVIFYLNGAPTLTLNTLAVSAGNFATGRYGAAHSGAYSSVWDGAFAKAQTYNIALTPANVNYHYMQGL